MAENPTVKLGVLISGSGTNLQAIIDAIVRGDLKAEIRLVISNRADAQGLERAGRHGIETAVIDHRKFRSREDFDRALLAALQAREVELVALAGFMRLLSPVMLDPFAGRIMNIHNSLLPSFPGIHGPKDAIEYGVKIAGCTVFFVTEGVDDGPITAFGPRPVEVAKRFEAADMRGAQPAFQTAAGAFLLLPAEQCCDPVFAGHLAPVGQ